MTLQLADREKISDEHPLLIPHGSPGLKRNAGFLDEEFHVKLKGKRGQRMYREMADNHAVIGASLWIIEALIRQVEYETEENESGHPLAPWGIEFAEQLFADCETPWKMTVGELVSFLVFGHAILEPEYKLRRGDADDPLLHSNHNDGLYGWRDLAFRPQESVDRWVFDDTGRLIGMIQRDPNYGATHGIPLDRMLLFRVRARKNNPEGYPLLRAAYPSYYYSKRLTEVEAIGLERNVAGMPDYQIPAECFGSNASADQIAVRNAALDFVKKIRVDAFYGAVRPSETLPNGSPSGYKFQLLSSSGKSFADTSPIINRHETRAAQVFMTEFMMAGTESSTGSRALHSDKTTLLATAIGAMIDIIDDEINEKALPRIWKANNLPRECMPKRKHGDIEKQQILETFNAVTQAVTAGAMEADDAVEGFLRKLASVPPREGASIKGMIADAATRDLGAVGTDPNAQPMPGAQPVADPMADPNAAADITDPAMQGTWDDPGGDSEEWLTLQEAADRYRVSQAVLRNAVNAGRVPGFKFGRNSFRIRRDKLEQMLFGGFSQ